MGPFYHLLNAKEHKAYKKYQNDRWERIGRELEEERRQKAAIQEWERQVAVQMQEHQRRVAEKEAWDNLQKDFDARFEPRESKTCNALKDAACSLVSSISNALAYVSSFARPVLSKAGVSDQEKKAAAATDVLDDELREELSSKGAATAAAAH